MLYSTPAQLCFPPVAGYTVRADFEGGALSSDFGALLLRGIDRQIGLTSRLAAAIHDERHPSYIDHPLRDLLAQRVYQIASGYPDGNDANSLRHDPLFKLSLDHLPLDDTHARASAPTLSRFEHQIDRKDAYRLARAFVEHFVHSYAAPPEAIVLDLDHTDDPTHGQQELAFYNHHYRTYCYLPLFIVEGTSQALVTACLRPGIRPTGAETAMIVAGLLPYLRHHWPDTHILVRGDSHFAAPELMHLIAQQPLTDFVFGLSINAVLKRHAAAALAEARQLHHYRLAVAQAKGAPAPSSSRIYDEFRYGAVSWQQPWRVVLKAEVMTQDDNPRFVVPSLEAPSAQMLYEDLYCARGHSENAFKALKHDLRCDLTSATTFLANTMRLFLACAAYVLHHALRVHTLAHTALAQAHPATVMLKLFKVAAHVKQSTDRIRLHLPSSCPLKALLHRVTDLLCAVPAPVWNTS